jgi:hypothetical protein
MFDEEVTSFSEVISHIKLQTITNFCNGLAMKPKAFLLWAEVKSSQR